MGLYSWRWHLRRSSITGKSDPSFAKQSVFILREAMGLYRIFSDLQQLTHQCIFLFYRKEKQLKAARWRAKEMASLNGGTLSFTKSPPSGLGHANHPVVLDDYSFDPLGASPGASNDNQYHGRVPPYTDYRDDPIHNNPSMNDEEIAFSSVWPESAPPTLFPAKATSAPPPKLSYSEELQKLPKQHVFAPPGKIGVAIDVFNGQPTVHKVRKGSPLENMLRANDVILSIDDVDTSCLSAADVTQLMVKRMDRVRKITFVRRA